MFLVGATAASPLCQAQPEHAAESALFHRTRADVLIDGRLDETAWQAAIPITRFFETFPRDRADPQVQTEARFLYDDSNLYIGVSAYDPDPARIRSGLVRRDGVTVDQDYIEILIDPLNTRRTALAFRTNASGVATDAQYRDDQKVSDLRPDLNFDVRTSIDSQGWHAEFRIPLSTLRYRTGSQQSWPFVIYRNRPRNTKVTIASIPEPRSSACALCFAGELRGISIEKPTPPIYVTPHVTYSHATHADDAGAGIDAKWVMRPDTVLDLTVAPDFSQVEADDLQLNANAQFTLALKEKRPFFLEGTDLFLTPINAIYTRSFSDPDAGARITRRGEDGDYMALVLRDRGSGVVVEPGPLRSTTISRAFDSTAIVGRYTRQFGSVTWGALGSARLNDGDGENYVYGFDGTWAPSTTDRLTVQVLGSATANPDRPNLSPSWDGRRMDGFAHAVSWQHASTNWYASLNENTYSDGFRAWNGFVPQVGVTSSLAAAGLLVYPASQSLIRFTPSLVYRRIREPGGRELSSDLAPTVAFTFPRSTELTIGWHPNAKNTTFAGTSTYTYMSAALTTTPAAWMPGANVTATFGDGIDFSTGEVNDAVSVIAEVPLRLGDRLELTSSLGFEAQERKERSAAQRAFTQRNTQMNVLWHFSNRLYAQLLYQDAKLSAPQPPPISGPNTTVESTTVSMLLSYQTNWQTRFFVGLRHSATDVGSPSSDTEVFAKVSYVLSKRN